jgi:hypothetical protein
VFETRSLLENSRLPIFAGLPMHTSRGGFEGLGEVEDAKT